MQMPKTVKIGPTTFTVSEVEGLVDSDGGTLFGMVRFASQEIKIEKTLHPTQRAQTLFHEILHVILEQMGRRDHDEGLINGIAYGLMGISLENKLLHMALLDNKPSDIGTK